MPYVNTDLARDGGATEPARTEIYPEMPEMRGAAT